MKILSLLFLQFQLGPSEFLTGVSGSIGLHNKQTHAITSLKFVSNLRSYGPFGKGGGTLFHSPMQSVGCIVGFFGRSDRYLNAIGVYMNHTLGLIGQEVLTHFILLFYTLPFPPVHNDL